MGTSRHSGFTLIELMVTIAVAAIILAFAIPSFESFVNANRLTSAANEMVASMQVARMEALRNNHRAVVCFTGNPEAATPSCVTSGVKGWITFLDPDNSGTFTANDTLLRTSALPTRVTASSSTTPASKVIFRSDGLAHDGTGALLKGAFAFCIDTTKPVTNARHVCIGSGSRVSTKSATSSGCAAAPANDQCDLP